MACFRCGEEGHFAKNCPNQEQRPQTGYRQYEAPAGHNTSVCYNCGGVGHFARECTNPPQAQPQNNTQGASNGNQPQVNAGARQERGGGGSARSCYVCGDASHLARNCPQGPSQTGGGAGQGNQTQEPSGAFKAQRGARGPKCYNCGELGHISKDCPAGEKGPKCYNCGGFGHISRECTAQAAQA